MSIAFSQNDGGRAAAGFKGSAGDCVARSVAIASGLPYREVYEALSHGAGAQRRSRSQIRRGRRGVASARNGINTNRKWFRDQMQAWGFVWMPTMAVGAGCTVHLTAAELPAGRLVVAVSKHYTAVINGVVHDTHDPSRNGARCVYGYWRHLADRDAEGAP